MILRAFSSNQPYTLIAIPVTILLALMPSAWAGGLPLVQADFPADDLFFQIYRSKEMTVAVASALLIAGAFFCNAVFNKHEFYNIPVFVPALMYAMLGSVISVMQLSLPALLANIFVLAGLNRQLQVFRQTRVLAEYFECGFWYGMAAVFFPPYIMLAVGLWITTIITRAFSWREHVLPLLAFSVPFLYWVVWKYWNNELNDLILFRKVFSYDARLFFGQFNWTQTSFMIVALAAMGLGLPRYLFLADRASNKARSVKQVFIFMAVAMILAMILGYLLVLKWILLAMLLPLTFIAGYWFTNYRYSLIAPLVFYVLCVCSTLVILNFYHLVP